MPPAAPFARRFAQLDVFADRPQRGNPLAVVLDAQGLTEEEMQRVARWTNLSETTFLLPPISAEADYRVRIFTPSGELPFAGHPTLGTARAWLEAGGIPAGERIVQECAAGLITVRRDADRLAFAAPPADGTAGPLYEVRAFTLGGVEDPVTGSLNAGIAQWMVGREPMPTRWTAAQGTALGRDGRIDVRVDADATIWIGGATVLTVEGSILV